MRMFLSTISEISGTAILPSGRLGIQKVYEVLLNNYGWIQKTTIYTDSQTALLAFNNCRKASSPLAGQLYLSKLLNL